jgi:hypothetical protein
VVAGGGSRAVTRASGGKIEIEGNFNEAADEIPYIRDLGDWLDDPEKVHPCNGDVSYHGFQAVIAACISSIERRPVILPLEEIPGVPVIDRLREIL